jgi:hypothetical protein
MQIPIKKAPIILTIKVGQGNHARQRIEKMALIEDPIAPPLATSRRNFQSIILNFKRRYD